MTAPRPSDADALARAVAGEYAARWARSLARASNGAEDAPWLVDAFAGADLQRAALRGASAYAPAVALLRAAEAFDGAARVVVIEEDPGLLARVEDELRAAGAEGRLRRTRDPESTEAGEIALVEAPFAAVADGLAEGIGGGAAVVRLAPLSARALPWIALEPLALLPAADLLIRMPGEDFARAGGFGGPLADFPPHLKRVAEGCSAMFADPRHGWLLAWREAARAGGADAALAGAVERLRTMLADAGEEGRMIRATRLEGGSIVHLLLSTPHAEHALELNGALADASAPPASAPKRRAPRSAPAATPPASPPTGEMPAAPFTASPAAPSPAAPPPEAADSAAVLDLFALPPAPEPPPRGPDLREAADELYDRHAGRRMPVRELLAGLADTGLSPEQVRTVLAALKRSGRAAFRSLDAEGAEIDFPAEPAPPPPPSAPRPRKPRASSPALLGLFDDPEAEAEPVDADTSAEPADEPEPSSPEAPESPPAANPSPPEAPESPPAADPSPPRSTRRRRGRSE